ncbi:MAG: xanthine dehydrogenase family protein molybdopterin-binding subunit [Desulfomonile tiedjei]|uniref:Xanthine dehydrogenase family protein molybdopterin-binding subunit n=1 Tax=Desulfomonile tiedjei TaxID=2358 RepID=A0A9D6Z3L1_9BACT|nr:xanthine dehydrogenase family protein molybdopterin-binding subunit [Desulfomonile tiedjei]
MKEIKMHNPESSVAEALSVDRRQFLKILGGGIIVYFAPGLPSYAPDTIAAGGPALPKDFNAFLSIAEDGRVSCFTGKVEMGQGIVVSLAQMLAEELDVPLGSVNMVMGDTDLCPWDAGTYGSMSVKYFGPPLRAAAAEARAVLIQLAGERLGVAPERLETKSGIVCEKQSPDKKVSYGELAKGKRIERQLPDKPSLKAISGFTISGKSPLRTDAVLKVTGTAKYAGDISLPGMLYARILRPPAHGAKLLEAETSAAEKIPGVQVVRERDLIAVLHSRPDEAENALKAIKAKFSRPETNLNDGNIFERLLAAAPAGKIVAEAGDISQGKGMASKVTQATYTQGYVAHAPMETHTAVAKMDDGKVTVWASTQQPFGAQKQVAEALSLPLQNVRIITPFLGGGFGGKNDNKQAVEAARLAKLTGKPVQVAWTRAEEFFYDTFQPAAVVKVESGLDASNKIVFWDYHVYFAGGDKAPSFYDIPHKKTTAYGSWSESRSSHPFGTGPWRGPNGNTNTFARESHMDELATKAGMDPLSFRLDHVQDKRLLRVLDSAAKAFGWSSAPSPSGKGRGMACGIYKGTCIAAMGEADVDKSSGRCQVKRLVCVQDVGQVVNPEGAKMQMEGCAMMGLGYALSEITRFRDGEILDLSFDTYQLPKFSWMPKIETVLIENPDVPPQEGGEPMITLMGALVANAIFGAIGVRFHELPMSPERVLKALNESRGKSGKG